MGRSFAEYLPTARERFDDQHVLAARLCIRDDELVGALRRALPDESKIRLTFASRYVERISRAQANRFVLRRVVDAVRAEKLRQPVRIVLIEPDHSTGKWNSEIASSVIERDENTNRKPVAEIGLATFVILLRTAKFESFTDRDVVRRQQRQLLRLLVRNRGRASAHPRRTPRWCSKASQAPRVAAASCRHSGFRRNRHST